ncbi:alpha/beta fold hydrolase [Amycolatopsis thermoflava]|uniref:alpha/beta fold hydrolase n=1 Tax=Amycolatopsis thermoflava TaxID=84480 RepID=UPI003EC0C7A2
MVRRVVSRDGTRIAVAEAGDPAAPTVVCVHGYPDDRSVWDGVAARLADRFHVVTYDVRGAGESDRPARRDGYALDRLAEDLAAVLDEVSPNRPAHLVAHDWGSIQSWHAVTGDLLRGRIASFTSISGPSLDHAGHWFRTRLRRPSGWGPALRQLVHSTYIVFFQIPLVPELGWRSGVGRRVLRRLSGSAAGSPAVADAVHGLELYRANIGARLSRPRPRPAEVPVQVLAPLDDPYVTPALQTDVARWAPRLWVRRLPGGHWIPRERPDVIARCTAELVDFAEGAPESRGLRRARAAGMVDSAVGTTGRRARAAAPVDFTPERRARTAETELVDSVERASESVALRRARTVEAGLVGAVEGAPERRGLRRARAVGAGPVDSVEGAPESRGRRRARAVGAGPVDSVEGAPESRRRRRARAVGAGPVDSVEGAPESRRRRQARAARFDGYLVVVTGESRFARAAAAAFARAGAEVRGDGPDVPDVVVDSRGTAREFAARMADRGEGGQLVLHDPAEAARLRREFPGLNVIVAGDGSPERAARRVLRAVARNRHAGV